MVGARLVTLEEFAALRGTTRPRVYYYVRRGRLRAVRDPRGIRTRLLVDRAAKLPERLPTGRRLDPTAPCVNAGQFAALHGVSRRSVLRWLHLGWIPLAVRHRPGDRSDWKIPRDAQVVRSLRGRRSVSLIGVAGDGI
jgi:hypothetical protein